MKRDDGTNQLPGLTPIWLLIFALVLGLLVTILGPIVVAPDPVKLSDWLGFAGSFAGAMVTLIAAAIAWRAVQNQIHQAESAMIRTRQSEQSASRALLPLALSRLIEYVEICVNQIKNLPYPIVYSPGLRVAEIPSDDIILLKECIRFSTKDRATQISYVLNLLQIQNARYRSVIQEICSKVEPDAPISVPQLLFDLTELYASITTLYQYARQFDTQIEPVKSADFKNALSVLDLKDNKYSSLHRLGELIMTLRERDGQRSETNPVSFP
jgi:hypothetical protein